MSVPGKEKSWQSFVAWCDARGLCSSPANPWTLAAYIRFVEGSMRLDALRRHIDQIGQMHYEKIRKRPDRHTMVKRTLDSVKRRQTSRSSPRHRPCFAMKIFSPPKHRKSRAPGSPGKRPRPAAPSGQSRLWCAANGFRYSSPETRADFPASPFVFPVPAFAGTGCGGNPKHRPVWAPACAGVTGVRPNCARPAPG